MTIQQLRPAGVFKTTTPQCEAQRVNRYFSDRFVKKDDLPQCEHSSSWVIDGKHLCGHHAGSAALAKLQRMDSALKTFAANHQQIDEAVGTVPGFFGVGFESMRDAMRTLREEARK